MALAKLDNFAFIMHDNAFKQLDETFNFNFAEHKKINAHASFQKVGAYSHELKLKGLLVAKKTDRLQSLIDKAKLKEPMQFTTIEHNFKVIIPQITQGKNKFLPDGTFTTQSFNITMKRVF
jgi:phage protein U